MIIVDLKGGLGNQLFQLAAGLLFAKTEKLLFNTRYYMRDSRHGGAVVHHLFPGIESQYINTSTPISGVPLIFLDEAPSYYDSSLLELRPPLQISGYFQNINYINKLLPLLRQQFNGNTANIGLGKYDQILRDSSLHTIGLHIRRGDYLIPIHKERIGAITLESIISCVRQAILAPLPPGNKYCILVVSDAAPNDLDGVQFDCEQHRVYFEGCQKVQQDLLQFMVLSRCQTLICSNSTYSYWAGCLNSRIERMYLPGQWLADGRIKTSDLLGLNMLVYECEFESI